MRGNVMTARIRSASVVQRGCSLLVALLLLVSAPGAVRADAGKDAYDFASGLYKDKRWSLAEEAFRKFVADYPRHEQVASGQLYLGLTQLQLQHYADARKTLSEFVKQHPGNLNVAHAEYRIAECTFQLDELEAAVTALQRCLKQYPEDAFRHFAWAYLGDAQRRLKRYADAATSLQQAIDAAPDGEMAVESRFSLAQVNESLDRVADAEKLYRAVAETAGSERADDARLALATLQFSSKKYDQALQSYLQLEKDFPQSSLVPVARLNAGFAQYQMQQYAKAMEIFDRAEQDASLAITAGYWKGLSLKSLGDHSGAAQVLVDVAKKAGDDPLAESILYQLADCEYRAGELADAEKHFLEISTRWPQSKHAAESLYFATECVIQQAEKLEGQARDDRLQAADLLMGRFAREYNDSGIRLSHNLLRGRFLMLRGRPDDLAEAAKIYTAVMKAAQLEKTQFEARVELARVQQQQGDQKGAIVTLQPLVDAVIADSSRGFQDVLLTYSHLALASNTPAEAAKAARTYLRQNASGTLRDQAWSYVALGSAQQSQWAEADDALSHLIAEHPRSPALSRTLQGVADTAYAAKQWSIAARFFQALMEPGVESPFHAAALSGLAWSEFKLGKFEAAEGHFREFVKRYPEHNSVAEASYMLASAQRETGRNEPAAAAFEETFRNFPQAPQAMAAGLEAARAFTAIKRVDDAHRVYGAVADAFAKAPQHPGILSEWAVAMYEAEQYDRSDAVFRKLVELHPDSEQAINARYSLAESDLIAGRIEPAKKEFAALAGNAKADAQVREDSLYRLIGIAVQEQQWDALVSRVNELQTGFPQSIYQMESQFHLGHAQLKQENFKAAELTLDKVAQLGVNDPEVSDSEWFPHVWALLAEAQFREKKYVEVLETADRMRKWNPDCVVAYQVDEVVGRSFKNQAQFDQARTAFQRVTTSEQGARTETAAKAQLMLAETWFLQKDYRQALREYLRVEIYQFPDWQAPALFQAGKCDELLGDKASAANTYRKLIEKYPGSEYADQAKERLAGL